MYKILESLDSLKKLNDLSLVIYIHYEEIRSYIIKYISKQKAIYPPI